MATSTQAPPERFQVYVERGLVRAAVDVSGGLSCFRNYAATPSHGSHAGSGSTASTRMPPAARSGARGTNSRLQPSSASILSALRELHVRQAATQFSHEWVPPRLRGTTWSIVSARLPQ